MALIVPTASSTYADSCETGGGPLRKYILAQYASDAIFEWVRELRAKLVKEELKYRDFRDARPKLEADRSFWNRVRDGVGQATVVVIDPEPFASSVEQYFHEQQAEPGIDYTDADVIDMCATAIIAGTPIAYLPTKMACDIRWSYYAPVTDVSTFTPLEIRRKLGGGLRDAKILAARAHAMFDLKKSDGTVTATRDVLLSPLRQVLLLELLHTTRIFDAEHPRSTDILNEAASAVANGMADTLPVWPQGTSLVREVDSRAIDEIQAADIAAGWARELAELGDLRSLGGTFRRVYVNGRLLDKRY